MNATTTTPKRSKLALSRPRRPAENFFCVWSPERSRPKQRHATMSAAISEAERLATLHAGTPFIVYELRTVARRIVETRP